jgi:hypothetical protein
VVRAPAPPPPPSVRIEPPSIQFSAPPEMVVVEPGVQVVEDADEEVFFVRGWYWHPGPNGVWWRTRDYRGGWAVAPRPAVPGALVHMPPGQYRHYRAEIRHERHEERREERREDRQERHEQRFERHHGQNSQR